MITLALFGVLPAVILTLLLITNRGRLRRVMKAVLFATLVHEVLLVTYPILNSVITQLEPEGSMSVAVGVDDLVRVMIGETLFVLLFSLTFWVGSFFNRPETELAFAPPRCSITANAEQALLRALIVTGMVVFGYELLSIGVLTTNNVFNQVVDWAGGVFFAFTPVAASAIFVVTERRWKTLMYAGAVLCITVVVATGVLTGTRGRIMWVLSLVAIAGYVFRKNKLLKWVVLFLIIVAPLFSFLGGYKNFAATTIVEGGTSQDLLHMLIQQSGAARDEARLSGNLISDFAARAQGPRNSVVLYREYDAGNSPGYSIYLGSLLFPVPRSFWPGKPLPGSPDEKEENSAIYKVVAIGHNLPYMGPVLASGHAYWEGGWTAVCTYGILTGLVWTFIFRLTNRLPARLELLLVLSLAASLLIDGFLTMFTPLYTFPLIAWKWILPTMLLYEFAIVLSKNTKARQLANARHSDARADLRSLP